MNNRKEKAEFHSVIRIFPLSPVAPRQSWPTQAQSFDALQQFNRLLDYIRINVFPISLIMGALVQVPQLTNSQKTASRRLLPI
ncbi:hypothetical protein BVY11_04860 [Pseudomonas amygdali pv. morsprunorum]|nr:hypothetical protein BVY12_19475 [Pseudomonas amygdali pv. morsprunorum]PPS34625.1 hypothetical protein BVY11_04860 [Pseudomonas amygdali pv. morsprunorum]